MFVFLKTLNDPRLHKKIETKKQRAVDSSITPATSCDNFRETNSADIVTFNTFLSTGRKDAIPNLGAIFLRPLKTNITQRSRKTVKNVINFILFRPELRFSFFNRGRPGLCEGAREKRSAIPLSKAPATFTKGKTQWLLLLSHSTD